jgi:hypothetical protein
MRRTTSLSAMTLIVALLAVAHGAAAVSDGPGGGHGSPAQVTIPADPSNLTAAGISTSAIRIEWVDNSSDEQGFKIEHCQGSTCTDFVQVATVSSNATNATISGLGKNKTYRYRVRAYNSAGNSGYSNIASGTTLTR